MRGGTQLSHTAPQCAGSSGCLLVLSRPLVITGETAERGKRDPSPVEGKPCERERPRPALYTRTAAREGR